MFPSTKLYDIFTVASFVKAVKISKSMKGF